MKSSELHALILRKGWTKKSQCGSHIKYEKNGRNYIAPYHGSKEVGSGLEKKIKKEMGLD